MGMHRRLIVGILLLALAGQGPALAYSAVLATPLSSASGGVACAGTHLPNGNACDSCCSHGSGFCATACALSLTAATPVTPVAMVVIVPRAPIPDAEAPPFVERHPARLLRPPIV